MRIALRIVASIVAFFAVMFLVDAWVRPYLGVGRPGVDFITFVLLMFFITLIWSPWKRRP